MSTSADVPANNAATRPECEPNEVWYAHGDRLRPMERKAVFVPRPGKLSAIRSEAVGSPK
jgi:hypothetical protein